MFKNRLDLLFAFIFCFAVSRPLTADTAKYDRNFLEMTDMAERKVRQNVESYLGGVSRAVVNVYFREDNSAQKAAAQSGDKLKQNAVAPGSWEIAGSSYLPAQVEEPVKLQEALDQKLSGADITIQVEKTFPQSKMKELEAVAGVALKGLKTNVKILTTLDPAKKDSSSDDRSVASLDPNSLDKDKSQDFPHNFKELMPLLSALILLIGFIIVGAFIKSSVSALMNVLQSLRVGSNSGTFTLENSESNKQLGDKNSQQASPQQAISPISNLELSRNIKIIEGYLTEDPLLLLRSIDDETRDILGLKFLVAKLSPEARTRLKDLFGAERILNASTFEAPKEVVAFDPRAWIQHLIESVEMKKLAGRSIIEAALKPKDSLFLSTIAEEDLYNVALKNNTAPIWRIVTEFISAEYMKKRSKDLALSVLMELVKASQVKNLEDLRSAVQVLMNQMNTPAVGSQDNLKASKESEAHFSKRVLPSLVSSISELDFGADENFIQDVVSEAPEFEKLIRSQIWTSSNLDFIADDSLREIFARLDNEKRAHILVSLPQAQKDRLEKFIPEGNAKKITLSIMAKLSNAADDKKRFEMRSTTRKFIEYLRKQYENQNLSLKVSHAYEAENAQINDYRKAS